MIKNWNADQIISELGKIYHSANDPNLTGWVNWPCKQDLYRVKFAVDEMLETTGTFVDEKDWLREQEQQRIIKILKK